MSGNLSQSYEGPLDLADRFEKVLEKYAASLDIQNDLRVVFHFGKQQGAKELKYAEDAAWNQARAQGADAWEASKEANQAGRTYLAKYE